MIAESDSALADLGQWWEGPDPEFGTIRLDSGHCRGQEICLDGTWPSQKFQMLIPGLFWPQNPSRMHALADSGLKSPQAMRRIANPFSLTLDPGPRKVHQDPS